MGVRKLFSFIIITFTVLVGIIMLNPLGVSGQELESVYEQKDSNGKVALRIKMKEGEISITTRSKAPESSSSIFWETIGYSITRLPIISTSRTKGYIGPGPVSDGASKGLASIYFKDGEKTRYEEGNEIITTVTFSDDKIKDALKDDFANLKRGTTIYLHGIFQSFRYDTLNGVNTKVIRKDNIKNWQDIMNAESWVSGTLTGFAKHFNMPIRFMPKLETPDPVKEPKKESIISEIDLPYLKGAIKSCPKGLQYFDVSKGIPTTESIYTNIESSPYLLGYHFEKKVGTKTYPVKVKKDYILYWYGSGDLEDYLLTSRQTVTQVVNISRPYGYWQITNFDLYSINKATINNYALPDKKVTMESVDKDLNVPSVVIKHSSLEKDHIIVPNEITNGITLEAEIIYGGKNKPSLPQENFAIEADWLIPNIKVKNDALVIGGNTIINDSIAEVEGPRVDSNKIKTIKDQGKKPNKGSSLLKENLIIEDTKENGLYHSSGTSYYKRILSQTSKHKEIIEYKIANINDVTIHTPVVCIPVYSSDNERFVQSDEISASLNLVLDEGKQSNDFMLHISNDGFHSDKMGYGKRDYRYSLRDRNTSYMATSEGQIRNEVKFPFDVYKYDSNGAKSLINKDSWIILSTDTHEFSLPIWVDEGAYTALCRSIAVNADLSKLDQISEYGANTKTSNYVATNGFDIDVTGRMYGLTIYDISDYPIWEDIFRVQHSLLFKRNEEDVYHDGTTVESYQKGYSYDYTIGTKDQYGNQTNRLSKYTLPLVDGSHPKYLNQGILKTGYGVRFRLTTQGNMFSNASKIVIRPSFYYVDSKGQNRTEVDLYYEETIGEENRKLVKVGDSLDSINMKFQEVGSPYTGIPIRELENTARLSQINYQDLIGRREGIFTFGHIQISSSFRTFPNENSQYTQNWYGYYYLPSILHVVAKDYDVYDYARKQGVNFKEDFWLDDGYIIVNMDIRAIDGYGRERLRYFNGDSSLSPDNSMWQTEGFISKKVAYGGAEFNFEEGDFLIYKINSRAQEDYTFDGL